MKYTTLGKTGLNISVIGLGGLPVQRTNQEGANAIVKACMEQGINFLDTARGYTVSEEFFGNALKDCRDKWVIASKAMSRDYEGMKADIETTLHNLQTDYIELYQMHNIRSEAEMEQCFGEDGAYKALLEAKEAGKIGYIGVTAHELRTSAILLDKYGDKIDTFMFPYNIVENQGEELMQKCSKKNIGFIAMKPIAGGNIEDPVLALKYILNNPNCTVVIPGMGDAEEVTKNTSEEVFAPLTEEDKLACDKIIKDLGSNFCRRCGYCAPCPQGIDIPRNFILVNYIRKYGLADWGRKCFAALPATAKDCVKCGICETRCPYDLPIRQMLEKVAEDIDAK